MMASFTMMAKMRFWIGILLVKVSLATDIFNQPMMVMEGDPKMNLDDELGTELIPPPDHLDQSLERGKRSADDGVAIDDTMFKLTEVASQTIAADQAEFGDSWTFELVIELPQIDATDFWSDLKIELFGLDPEYGVFAFHMCQVHHERLGSQIRATQSDPVYEMQPFEGYPNIVGKAKATLEHVHTGNQPSNGDQNTLKLQFQALMMNPEIADGTNASNALKDGKDYYITAGVEYGTEGFIWTGQAKVTTALQSLEYDSTMSLYTTESHKTIRKGDSELFLLETFITAPMAGLQFVVKQPLGYTDYFHIGNVGIEIGNAFACSINVPAVKYSRSPSGIMINSASFETVLVNRDATRDVSKDWNKITFAIPITVANNEFVEVDSKKTLMFSLEVDGLELWVALHEIMPLAFKEPSDVQDPIVASTIVANNFTTNGTDEIIAGNAVLFNVTVNVPPGYNNFKIEVDGSDNQYVSAVGARVLSTGTVAYIPTSESVKTYKEVQNTTIQYDYGKVKNVGEEATKVVLELAYKIHHTAGSSPGVNALAKLNGNDILLPSFNIVQNDAPDEITVVSEVRNCSGCNKLYSGGQGAIQFDVTVPPSAGNEDLYLEAVPDLDVIDVNLELCAIRVHRVGSGLPCIFHSNPNSRETHAKSDSTRPFDDSGSLNIGSACPVNYANGGGSANQFTASMYWRRPQNQASTSTPTMFLGGGMSVGGTKIVWPLAEEYVLDDVLDNKLLGILAFDDDMDKIPYVTSYPIITTRGRSSEAFMMQEGFFIKYILKFPPGTMGTYTFRVWEDGTKLLKLCKLQVQHIGANMPCTKVPTQAPTLQDSIMNTDSSNSTCGVDPSEGEIEFVGLTNWGKGTLEANLNPDENSVTITAFFQVCGGLDASVESVSVHYELKAKTTDEPSSVGFKFSTSDIYPNGLFNVIKLDPLAVNDQDDGARIAHVSLSSLSGPEGVLLKQMANIFEITVEVPSGYWGDLEIALLNDHFDDNVPVDICGMSVISIGANIPCLKRETDVLYDETVHEPKTVDGRTFMRSTSVVFKGICYIPVDHKQSSKTLTIEAAVRVPSDIEDIMTAKSVSKLNLTVRAVPVTEQLASSFTFSFEVVSPSSNSVSNDTIEPHEVGVAADPTQLNAVVTGGQVWLDYTVTFPPLKTAPARMSVLTPSAGGRAIVTLTEMAFGPQPGRNVLCVGPEVHLPSSYNTTYVQSDSLDTFMQKDYASVDMGYITNSGWSIKQSNYNPPTDDQFVVRAKVQMTDHPLTSHNNTFEVYLAMMFGDVIVVSSSLVTAVRHSTGDYTHGITTIYGNSTTTYGVDRFDEEPRLIVEAKTNVADADILAVNDTVGIEAVIRHHHMSQGEGIPTRLRVFTPDTLALTKTKASNYTCASCNVNVISRDQAAPAPGPAPATAPAPYGSSFDFEFDRGILFSDYVNLNFSLTVDPKNRARVGGHNAAVVVQPICNVSQHNDSSGNLYPSDTSDYIACGEPDIFYVKFEAGDCDGEIPFYYSCQIRASSQNSPLSGPSKALQQNEGRWTPALRTGAGWRHHLDFDFLAVARINSVSMNPFGANMMETTAKTVLILKGSGPDTYEEVGVFESTNTSFSTAIQSRYMRIVILEANDKTTDELALAVGGIAWRGCATKDPDVDYEQCFAGHTVDAADPVAYRHFTIDDDNLLAYFCDISPYLDRMVCYKCDLEKAPDVKCKGLPLNIASVAGYSPSTHRTYFKDRRSAAVLSSRDGDTFEVTSRVASDAAPAVEVPGYAASALGEKKWWPYATRQSTAYRANFNGLFQGDVPLVKWSGCCNP